MCPSVENPELVFQKTRDSQSLIHPRPSERGSRQARPVHPEWSLLPEVFQSMSRWIDLFATRFKKLPLFVLPVADPLAWAVETLSLPWEDLDANAFSPTGVFVQGGGEVTGSTMPQYYSDFPRVAQHALILGPSDYVKSDPFKPFQPVQLAQQICPI